VDHFWFWAIIVTLCAIAAIINFILAYVRRKHPTLALIRAAAGTVSLLVALGIILGKVIAIAHPYLSQQNVFIGVGVFIALVFLLPSYFEKNAGEAPKVSLQQRAARPANATVRLRDTAAPEEWMN
jgi:cation transport ATPase